jgi:hydrogenase-4 component F
MPKTFVAFFGGFAGIPAFRPSGFSSGELFIVIGAFRAGHYVGGTFHPEHLCDLLPGLPTMS